MSETNQPAAEVKPLRCYITKNLGAYNWANTQEKQWSVQVLMPDGKMLSEMWPEDEEPDTDGLPPSEVIELIVTRTKSYWVSTRRGETLARIEQFRPMFAQMDDAWAREQIKSLERRITSLRHYLITDEVAE
jgi:hypothetical protein